MRVTVVLFDIDGTLVTAQGTGKRCFLTAFDEVTAPLVGAVGPRGATALDFSFGGMTDFAIARAGVLALGLVPERALLVEIIDRYLEILAEVLAVDAAPSVLSLVPGARACVDQLAGVPGLALGLGTGNVRRGAELKLAPHALWAPFAFGGFGCDAEDRAELLRCGALRGAAALGVSMHDARVVVVGDTLRDVAAARAIGASCVGIATGHDSVSALRAAGASHAFPTLEPLEALHAIRG
jgi:phosphoglycolate phosphatase